MRALVRDWGQGFIGERGYSSVGAVVGATFPEQACRLRTLMPESLFLVPGYGSQSGTAQDVLPCFNSDGHGAIVNSSCWVIFAYQRSGDEAHFDQAARQEAGGMKEDLTSALKGAGICPW